MQFKKGTDVYSSEGERMGKIDRVVIDPRSKEVSHFVVEKGLFFPRDKVVPVDRIDSATEERIVLKKGSDNPDDFPDFEESHYVPLDTQETAGTTPSGYAQGLAWYYPLAGTGWWGVYPWYPISPYITKTERNIPEGTIALEEGAKVLSREGDHVGNIERIYTEPAGNRATHFLISQGLFSKERRLIPTVWVDRVSEDQVHLSVDTDFVRRLPLSSDKRRAKKEKAA